MQILKSLVVAASVLTLSGCFISEEPLDAPVFDPGDVNSLLNRYLPGSYQLTIRADQPERFDLQIYDGALEGGVMDASNARFLVGEYGIVVELSIDEIGYRYAFIFISQQAISLYSYDEHYIRKNRWRAKRVADVATSLGGESLDTDRVPRGLFVVVNDIRQIEEAYLHAIFSQGMKPVFSKEYLR